MNRQTESTTEESLEHLYRARLLADSFERAIEAISKNSVEALERELQEQTMHCAELAVISRCTTYRDRWDVSRNVATFSEDHEPVYKRLRLLLDRYEAVLYHSGRTIRMLQALNRAAFAERERIEGMGENGVQGVSWLA